MHLYTDRYELSVETLARPDNLAAMGQDQQGLYAHSTATDTPSYWQPPQGDQAGDFQPPLADWTEPMAKPDATLWASLPDDFPSSWASDWGEDAIGVWMSVDSFGIRQRLRYIPPGEFIMGSPPDEPERDEGEVAHPVCLTQGFWLADTACTQALWQAIMGDNPSHFKDPERPVDSVSWNDTQRFIKALNDQLQGADFALPSEAQWEYACRAGQQSAFAWGDQISPETVNYDGQHPYFNGAVGLNRAHTVAVKALACNDWGLYQMHGNVWEWCQDRFGPYADRLMVDPQGPAAGELRVLRGGSWVSTGKNTRCAQRNTNRPEPRANGNGFRLAHPSRPTGAK